MLSKICKEKPLISNQHGALVMAFVPFIYGIYESHFVVEHILFGTCWLFIYLFSYPFLAIFSKKNNEKYKRWAIIYGIISTLLAIPLLFTHFSLLQFFIPILPLALIQIYYAKQKNERHFINDISGIFIFGIVGMASFYLPSEAYAWTVFLHPTLFFIATTLYIKSVARERKNPLYLKLSILIHCIFLLCYLILGDYGLVISYTVALMRAIVIPKKNLTIKKIGILEFGVVFIFMIGLIY